MKNVKEKLFDYIDSNYKEFSKMADDVFDHPEMAFNEYYASELFCDWLVKNDYHPKKSIGTLDTSFKGHFKNGNNGIRIGLLCEYDALSFGHACAHHMQTPIMFLAAQALRNVYIDKPYELILYGTPAEEGGQGKRIMLENGCFEDIDIALTVHGAPNTTVDIKSLSGSKYYASFKGVAVHESLTPEKVRNGLDALQLAFQGLMIIKMRAKEDVKLGYSIKDCRGMPENNDPSFAACEIIIRTYHEEDVSDLEERVIKVLEGAAIMTETELEYKKLVDVRGKLPSLSLNQIIMDNARYLNSPQILEYRERTGSTDFAFVTHHVPGAVIRFPFVPEGTSSHSQTFLDYGKSRQAHEGIKLAAKIVAATMFDLIENEENTVKVKEEFEQRKSKSQATTNK